jgi:hypothetical protein
MAIGFLSSEVGFSQCNNVTWGGTIGSNQSGGVGYNPSSFLNVSSPSGGSGSIEYMWIYKNSSTGWVYQPVNGANSATYNAPSLNETTIFRRCARRSGCSSWDGESNEVTVTITSNSCNNLTDGGTIGSDQSGCAGFDAAPLTNIESPSGGSGALEIIWMYWNASTGWNMTQIPGANGLTYDPGMINEDTYFRRCSRRQGCSSYDGESNDVFMDVTACCNAAISQVAIYNLGNGTSMPLTNGSTYNVSNLPASWNVDVQVSGSTAQSVVFDWSGSYSTDNTQNASPYRSPDDNTALNLGAGSYTLRVKLYSADNGGGLLCDEEVYSFTVVACENVPPVFGVQQSEYDLGCTESIPMIEPIVSDNGGSVQLTYTDLYSCNSGTPASCDFRTYTQGGWGAPANGNNPGVYRNANFAAAFPQGLVIGCQSGNTLTLTSAQAVQDFLPSGSTPSALPGDLTNPGNAYDNVFAGQLVAITLSLGFDAYDPNFAGSTGFLGDQIIGSGTFEGMTIAQVVAIANQVIGGCSNQYSFSALNDVLSDINENFVGGANNGFIECVEADPACACTWHRRWTATDLCGNTATFDQYFITGDNEGPIPGTEPEDVSVQCLDEVPAAPVVTFTDDCGEVTESWFCEEINQMDECAYQIVRDWFATDGCNMTMVQQIINVNDTTSPVFDDQQSEYDLGCTESVPLIQPTVTDNCSNVQLTYADLQTCNNNTPTSCDYRTYTQGGWGAPANGNNPGVYRNANFASAFPQGLVIGCQSGNTLTLTSAQAVQDFLPSGSTPSALPGDLTNPGNAYDNVFAGQLVALTLSLGFDAYDPNFAGSTGYLGDQIIGSGTFEGMTISQVVAIANQVIGGCSNQYSFSSLNEVLSDINENFAGGSNHGFVVCVEPDPACACTWHRRWTATDLCGNSATFDQYFIIGDNEGPVPSNEPQDITVQCLDEVPAAISVTFTDDCGEVTETWMTEETQQIDECTYQIVREWFATDGCNTTIVDQIISVIDNTNPVFVNLPDNASVECGFLPTSLIATASDNCDDDVEVSVSFEDSGSGCNLTRVFTIVATDDCGNSISATRTYSVYDNENPILIGVPENNTVVCDQIPSAPAVYAEDNCDDNIPVAFDEEISEGCPYTITRTWTAADDCGNSVSATQILTVIDETGPVLYGVPDDMTLECDQNAPEAVVYAGDNCDQDMIISMTAVTTDLDCGSVFTRTWSVTDDCGNTTTATQVINFVDTTDPYVTEGVPSELTIECDEQAPFYMPEFADNCDDTLSVSAISGISNVNPCGYDIERAWTATDDCGNSITVYQVIHVVDTTNPELVGVPANSTVECDAVPAPAEVSATDNCGDATVAYSQTSTEGCPYTITRTWTATDACGNQSSASQIITVVDTTDPVIAWAPAIEVTVECGTDVPFEEPVFDDNCDENLSVSYIEETTSGACLPGLIRTWVATDDCGNSVQFIQYVSIIDTTDPYFNNLPENMTVECDEVPGVAEVTASDICDQDVAVSFNEESTEGCPYTITRTWTAWDDCDNMITGTQVITVVDTHDPILHNVPADLTLECDQPAPGYDVWASDNCDLTLSVEFDESTQNNECGYVVTRTWSVTDDCGNTTEASQVINFVDTTDPYVIEGVPAELTIECDMDAPVFTPQFGDNCDMNLAVNAISGISNVNPCGYDIERAWTATDDCGNSTTISQVIHVVDTTDPVLEGVPANTVAECNNIPTPASVFATDNCSEATVEFSQTATQGCPYVITRTWTATDECGNQSVATQVIEVVDTQDPTLQGVPANAIVECSDIPAAPVVTATDNCDQNIAVEYNEEIVPVNNCTYNIVRTWSAMDDCGNEVSASQTLQVVDTTQPELIGVPADATVECDEIPSTAIVYGDDNCDDNVEVDFEEVVSLGCPYTITRTWTGVDNCGNSTTATQVITVIDSTYPVLYGVPADVTLECDQPTPDAIVEATDNCTEDLAVSLDAQTEMLDCGYTLTRTWSVSDACGNTTTATQVITFVDTTNPVVVLGVPAELTIECDQEEPSYNPEFADNCDDDLALTAISGINNVSDCGYDIERTWTATDDCGNSVSVSQVIHVVDSTNPVLVGVPANTTVNCDEIPAPAQVTATDNCSTPAVSMSQLVSEGCPYTITRTWTATDICGNSSSATQVITVVDTQDPVVVNNPPVYYVIECGEALPVNNPVFTDNCDQELDIEFSEEITSGGCPNSVIRTWVATDNCGNSIEFVQFIGISDTTDPIVVEGVPAELTFECDQDVPSFTPVFFDSCDDDLTLTAASGITNVTDCGYDIERTWSAEDDCENVVTVTQIIHIVDTTDPVLAGVPQDATYECGQQIPAPATVTGSDNCDEDLDIVFSEEEFAQDCGYYLIRTWRAYDNCGNEAVESQYIYVVDETEPVISGVPADITIECDQPVPAAVEFTATDNCDQNLTVEVVEEIIPGECGYQIKRYYNATDDCGNMASVPHIITIVDTTAPVMEAPESVTVSCDNIPAAPEVAATDNCDENVLVVFDEQVEDGCPYTITRTWTATDNCGNETVVTQYVSVYDEVNPVFDAYLPFVTVECDQVDEYMLTATDNCDADVEVTVIEESQVSGQCYGSLLRTYEATDNCGNSVTAFQIIDIVDSTAPVIYNVPADVTIYCGDDAPVVPTDVYATDNCTAELVVSFEQTQTNTFCPFDIIRTWTAVDDCGNATVETQVIHVEVEVADDVNITAFPNPAAEEFAVKFSTPTDAVVFGAIYDVTGREVQPFFNGKADGGRLYNWSMNAQVFEAGTYNIRMVVNDKVYNERLIISNK